LLLGQNSRDISPPKSSPQENSTQQQQNIPQTTQQTPIIKEPQNNNQSKNALEFKKKEILLHQMKIRIEDFLLIDYKLILLYKIRKKNPKFKKNLN